MEKVPGKPLYEHKAEFLIGEAIYPWVIYDDWEKKLYVTYTEHPEPAIRGPFKPRSGKTNMDNGKIILVREHACKKPVKKYGLVDMTSAPYNFETVGRLNVDPVAVSSEYLYVVKYINRADFLFRVCKASGKASRLFELPSRSADIIILNGENNCIVRIVGPEEEGYPYYLYLVPLEVDARESFFEKPAFKFRYYPGLTQLQPPEFPGIVLESQEKEPETGGYISRVYLLNLNGWRLRTLFEFAYADLLPISGAFFWLYDDHLLKPPGGISYVNNMYWHYE
jgi:hypothetical protein